MGQSFVAGQTYRRKHVPEAAPEAARNPFDWEVPLERIRGESGRANIALRGYVMLGPGRTLVKLLGRYEKRVAEGLEPPSVVRVTLAGWSVKFQWAARSERFDELESQKALARWQRRFAELREQEWRDAEELRGVAVELLREMPRFKTRQEYMSMDAEGNPIKVIAVALNATLGDIVRALEEASALQRKAVDQPNEHIKLSGSALDKAIQTELARLSAPTTAPLVASRLGVSESPVVVDGTATVVNGHRHGHD